MRRALLGTSLLALMLFTACSGSDRRSNDDDDDGGNSTTTNGGMGGNGSGGGSDSTGPGGADALPTCYQTCAVAADCILPNGGTLYDADNYACEAGRCVWTGCTSTTECTSALMSPNYACAPVPGASFTACRETCTTAADCELGPGAVFDADNYACNGGLCEWTGCNDTAECTESFGQNYICAPVLPGASFSTCYTTCTTAADCDTFTTPAYDADNHACRDGLCVWTGCNNTAECIDMYMNQSYVCE